MSVRDTHGGSAFLVMALGGTGKMALPVIRQLFEADGRRFPAVFLSVDTDPTPAPGADREVLLALDGQKARAVAANAAVFGPAAVDIVQEFGTLLDPENVRNGSRTTRALTQLSVLYFRDELLGQLHAAVLDLYRRGGFTHVIPVLISSSGGGAGSALQILLPQLLRAARMREAIPDGVVQTPIQFVVEPFAYAFRNQSVLADKILANAFAFRLESAALEILGLVKYCFHLGLVSAGGAVLDTSDEIARVLGTSVYQFLDHWPQIKSLLVNGVDTHAETAHYSGRDVWERVRTMFHTRTPAAHADPARNGTTSPGFDN